MFSWVAVEFTSLKSVILGPAERLIALLKIDAWIRERPKYKSSPEKTILFVSSSLGVAAAYLADYEIHRDPSPLSEPAIMYSHYKCLDRQISQSIGQTVRTINLSSVAALVSEDFLIAKEAVRLGSKPSLIILAIAPRDFLDHYTAAYHRSRLAQILLTRQASPSWDLKKSIQENLDKLLCKAWPYYSQRVEYRDLAVKKACESFNRSASLFAAIDLQVTSKTKSAQIEKTPEPTKQEAPRLTPLILKDDKLPEEVLVKFDNDYRGRYLPLDTDRWKLEMESLFQFTQFCQNERIPLLVVAMPITERNRNLLPKDFLTKHVKLVSEITKIPPTMFLDLMADPRFTPSDFSDTVHLRSKGSIKLTEIISEEIQRQHLLH